MKKINTFNLIKQTKQMKQVAPIKDILNISLLAMSAMLVSMATYTYALEYQPKKHLSHVYAESMYAPSDYTQVLNNIGEKVKLTVIDTQYNKPLPIYLFNNQYWIAGTPNKAYIMELISTLKKRRALATVSVDGINVITGEDANVLQRGYILSPNKRYKIAGWRKNIHEVATFKFVYPQYSYADQVGRSNNLGIIGMAVFSEHYPSHQLDMPDIQAESDTKHTHKHKYANNLNNLKDVNTQNTQNNPQTMRFETKQGLGTQHGEIKLDQSSMSSFKRSSESPNELISLRYDTVDGLVSRGVLRWVPQPANIQPYSTKPLKPISFPKYEKNKGYVPDPPQLNQPYEYKD